MWGYPKGSLNIYNLYTTVYTALNCLGTMNVTLAVNESNQENEGNKLFRIAMQKII